MFVPWVLVACSLLTHRFITVALVDQIKAQNAQLKSQNDLRIMESLSPKSKEAMSKQMAMLRMREMQAECDRLQTHPANVNASDTDVTSNLTGNDADGN